MTDDWQVGSLEVPRRPRLTPEQQEAILKDLRSVEISEDIFAMDPMTRKKFLRASPFLAKAVYAAIKHELQGEYQLTQSFDEWSREMGLS